MTCNDVRELLPIYWEMPPNDSRRLAVDRHVAGCEACREELAFWEQSEQWIRDEAEEVPQELTAGLAVSSQVMKRIYTDESWRLPIPERMYTFSDKVRRSLMLCIAFCLALFVGSFMYALFTYGETQGTDVIDNSILTIQTPQKLEASSSNSISTYTMKTAAASVSQSFIQPIPFRMGPLQSYSNFLLIVSIVGFIGAMLVMNWINRVKA